MREKSKKLTQSVENPEYSGTSELLNTENGLIGYSKAIVKKFHKNLNVQKGSRILEFGAGIGFLAELFYSEHGIKPTCVEIDPSLCQYIKNKDFECFQTLDATHRKFQGIYTSNVLEHIEDDVASLKQLREFLEEGGKLAIYVPANPILFSAMDESVGHIRRYTKRELVKKTKLAGLKVNSVQYDDFLGFFASLLVKAIGYSSSGLGSTGSLRFYDKVVYPISSILDTLGFKKIIGKNLFLVCEKFNQYEEGKGLQ